MKKIKLYFLILGCLIFLKSQSQDWEPLGSGIEGNNVLTAAELNGKIYFGGNFTSPGNYLVSWNPSNGQWTDIGGDYINFYVSSLVIYDGKLYAAGAFYTPDDSRVAAYDPVTETWEGIGDADGLSSITDLFVYNNYIYVSGNGYSKKSMLGSSIWETMGILELPK